MNKINKIDEDIKVLIEKANKLKKQKQDIIDKNNSKIGKSIINEIDKNELFYEELINLLNKYNLSKLVNDLLEIKPLKEKKDATI